MKNIKLPNYLYITVLLIFILYRAWIILAFNLNYIDSDQTIMWAATDDFSKGIFHETRFYGQNYNSMIEALFASVFYSLGIKLKIILPVITTVLAFSPFVVLSWFTFKKRSKLTGILIICFCLLFSFQYDLITTLPRGFATGLFVYTFIFPLLFREEFTSKTYFWIAFLMMLGFTINANTAPISCFVSLFILLKSWKIKKYYVYSSLGFIVGWCINFLLDLFYYFHPNYILHKSIVTLDFSLIKNGLANLDRLFNNVIPIFWHTGFLVLPFFHLISILFYKKNKPLFIVCNVFPVFLIATLSVNKIYDGTNSIFFSYSRMYLSLPLIIVFVLSFIRFNKYLAMSLSALALIAVVYKIQISEEVFKKNYLDITIVSISKVKDFEVNCKILNEISQKHKIDLIVTVNDYKFYDFTNYGCACVENQFPKTLRPIYERRTWRLLEDQYKKYKNILFIDYKLEIGNLDKNLELINRKKGYYVLHDNQMNTLALLKKLHIQIREF